MLSIKKLVALVAVVLGLSIGEQALAKCELDKGYELPEDVVFSADSYQDKECYFIEGLAIVVNTNNGGYGFVNKQGEVEIPLEYEEVVRHHDHISLKKNGKWYGYKHEYGLGYISNE